MKQTLRWRFMCGRLTFMINTCRKEWKLDRRISSAVMQLQQSPQPFHERNMGLEWPAELSQLEQWDQALIPLYASVISHCIWAAPRKEGMTLSKWLSSTKGSLQNEIWQRCKVLPALSGVRRVSVFVLRRVGESKQLTITSITPTSREGFLEKVTLELSPKDKQELPRRRACTETWQPGECAFRAVYQACGNE